MFSKKPIFILMLVGPTNVDLADKESWMSSKLGKAVQDLGNNFRKVMCRWIEELWR